MEVVEIAQEDHDARLVVARTESPNSGAEVGAASSRGVFEETEDPEELGLAPDGGERLKLLSSGDRAALDELFGRLCEACMEQPQVFVHRDYHARNLMVCPPDVFGEGANPGIIDFQDAVHGPLSYDFVSLVWDRYHSWPRDRIERWMEQFRRMAAADTDPDTWCRWCDLMGLQRNLKIVGRFALLKHEQGKSGYMEMVPRFYRHVLEVLRLYPEFEAIAAQLGDPACAP